MQIILAQFTIILLIETDDMELLIDSLLFDLLFRGIVVIDVVDESC